MGQDGAQKSESGAPIYRHDPAIARSAPPSATQHTDLIAHHIAANLGEVSSVFHEMISDLVHLDINFIQPSPSRPYHTLVTSGMSDRPMKAPTESPLLTRAELTICLPPKWRLSQEDFRDDRNYWPLRLLKELARLPHQYKTWLWEGHTVPNGDPPRPYSRDTRLCCALLCRPKLLPEQFFKLEAGTGKTIHFFSVVPIYREEIDYKLKKGYDSLAGLLQANGVTELLDLRRVNVCRKSFFARG